MLKTAVRARGLVHVVVSAARIADAPAIKRKLTRSPLLAQEQHPTHLLQGSPAE